MVATTYCYWRAFILYSVRFDRLSGRKGSKTFSDIICDGPDETLTGLDAGPGDMRGQTEAFRMSGAEERMVGRDRLSGIDIQAGTSYNSFVYDFCKGVLHDDAAAAHYSQ